jgi:hypothetical protein
LHHPPHFVSDLLVVKCELRVLLPISCI